MNEDTAPNTTFQEAHLFAVLLLFSVFLIVFFEGVERGRVDTIQTFGPLPIEGTELLFAAGDNETQPATKPEFTYP